jgi:hypothetical protein
VARRREPEGRRVTARAGRGIAVLLLALAAAACSRTALAQDEEIPEAVSDTTFEQHPHNPITYMTSYDLNVSRGLWLQTLDYGLNTKRVSFQTQGSMEASEGKRGLETNGISGSLNGTLSLRATDRWIWSLNGIFSKVSQASNNSTTEVHQNRLQLRTQYSAKAYEHLQLLGLVYTELQMNQSLGETSVQLRNQFDTRSTRDSSYTSGNAGGFTGSATWTPRTYLRWNVTGTATQVNTTTNTVNRKFYLADPDSGVMDSIDVSNNVPQKAPNGSRALTSAVTYTGWRQSNATLTYRDNHADQEYFALNRGAQEHIAADTRTGAVHFQGVATSTIGLTLDASIGRTQRVYRLQNNLNTLVHSQALTATAGLAGRRTRAALSLDLGRLENSQQTSQNGTTITRILGANGMHRLTRRLTLDGLAGVTLISNTYEVSTGDRDDQRASVNVGGGYLVSRPCSTAVHFSVNRSHTVALSSASSADNNVQTSYQMNALLKLQVSPDFLISQNYQLTATYFIYDYAVSENKNTLTRIRRIDTAMTDSIFTRVYLRLAHNFLYLDRGAYAARGPDGNRLYDISFETYQQNLGLTLGVKPIPGVILNATQSLASTKDYFLVNNTNAVRNHWNFTIGALVNRELPAGIALTGSVQHISEYTEVPPDAPPGTMPTDVQDYWLAGAALNKEF